MGARRKAAIGGFAEIAFDGGKERPAGGRLTGFTFRPFTTPSVRTVGRYEQLIRQLGRRAVSGARASQFSLEAGLPAGVRSLAHSA